MPLIVYRKGVVESMKKRLISGLVYAGILVGCFLLKIFVHDFFLDGLLYLFALLGAFEVLRAVKGKITKTEGVLCYGFAIVAIPACALFEYFFGLGLVTVGVCFLIFAVCVIVLLVFDYEKTTIENVGVSLLSGVYPTLLLCLLVLVNHAVTTPNLAKVGFDSHLLILFIFIISPMADSFAYLFGMTMGKKFPKKMAPSISPNKTRIGGIGGLFGGVVASVILYFAYGAVVGNGYAQTEVWLPVYIGIGLLTALATELGDLVESAIKRKVGIKDMGNVMPGHGGIMDRIDGTLFASLAVYAVFLLIRVIV